MSATRKTGVILVNLGTPEAPTAASVKKYLKQFLSDGRVIEVPKIIWWWILNLIILNLRPSKVAKLYQGIWWEEGSPMRVILQRQIEALRSAFYGPVQRGELILEGAMTYGEPALARVIDKMMAQQVERIVVLPLYPQYSATTTAAVFDQIADWIRHHRNNPEWVLLREYHVREGYIQSLANSIEEAWNIHGQPQQLVFSFHGIPKSYADKGDPYPQQCHATAKAVAQRLELQPEQWQVTFQSRFGPQEWLTPYLDKYLESLPEKGIEAVHVISPAFSADCLETLEEIAEENKEVFLESGGKTFHYIPALNDREDHIHFLQNLILEHLN